MPSRAIVLAAIAVCAVATAACGSSAPRSQVSSQSAPSAHPLKKRHRPHRSRPRVGTSERVLAAGTTLSVTVTRVIGHLGDSGAALQPGTRGVGVVVRIQNHGPGVYDSSATGDVSIVPSTGSARPVFAAHGVCQTPLRDFDNYITAGEVRQGCVAFSIQAGAKVAAVNFSPHGQAAGRASWAVSG